MKRKFRTFLTSIFSTAIGLITTTNDSVASDNTSVCTNKSLYVLEQDKQRDLSKKLVLKPSMAGDNSLFVAWHRSHRSHYSHRSSRYGGYTYISSYGKTSVPVVKNSYKLGDRIIKEGMSGKDVTEVVMALASLKYLNKNDFVDESEKTIYSDNLKQIVQKFQSDNDITVDGIIGVITISKLKEKVSNLTKCKTQQEYNLGDRVLRKGMCGKDVTELKNILIDKGFISGDLVKGITEFGIIP